MVYFVQKVCILCIFLCIDICSVQRFGSPLQFWSFAFLFATSTRFKVRPAIRVFKNTVKNVTGLKITLIVAFPPKINSRQKISKSFNYIIMGFTHLDGTNDPSLLLFDRRLKSTFFGTCISKYIKLLKFTAPFLIHRL